MKRLLKYVELRGVLLVMTGLRIGAGIASLEIGGLDNAILRHPETRVPYLPGSSIKGKLRSLLEVTGYKSAGRPVPAAVNGPCGCNSCAVCWLFGCGDAKKTTEPTRLIFRDCPILAEDEKRMKELLKDGVFYSEVKAEVTMDRAKGTVGGAGPRNMDRIMAGTKLDFRLTVRVLEGDDEAQMKAAIVHAFRLLEKDGLGGSVSRGYGQVSFEGLTWEGQDLTKELHPGPPKAV